MADSETYAKSVLKVAVSQIAQRLGFKRVESAALEALTDATANFIETVGEACVSFEEHCGASRPRSNAGPDKETDQGSDGYPDGESESLELLNSGLSKVYRQYRLKPSRLCRLVNRRLQNVDSKYERQVLRIPAELDNDIGAKKKVPLASTIVGRKGDFGGIGGRAESQKRKKNKKRSLKNVPAFMHKALPHKHTYQGTKEYAVPSNARLARHINLAESGVGNIGKSSANLNELTDHSGMRGKKEDFFKAKRSLRTSLNQLWGSTTTFNARMDWKAFEEKQRLQQLQHHRERGSAARGMPRSAILRSSMGTPQSRKRSNSSDLTSPLLSRRRSNSMDGVPPFNASSNSSSSSAASSTSSGAGVQKRLRLSGSSPAMNAPKVPTASVAAQIATSTLTAKAVGSLVAPLDSKEIEPEEPPTVVVAENKK